MFGKLPDALIIHILVFLALPSLKSTKAVNKKIANFVREVLRSGTWHRRGNNIHELSYELQSTTVRIQFPMKVALLEEFLPGHRQNAWCLQDDSVIATIYSLNVVYSTNDCSVLDRRVGLSFEGHHTDKTKTTDFLGQIVDLCIEIPGFGIIASEEGLRIAMYGILRDRGVDLKRGFRRYNGNGETLKIFSVQERDQNNPSELKYVTYDKGISIFNEFTTNELLDFITIITNVGNGTWLTHGLHGFRGDADYTDMTMRFALMFHDSNKEN